ncbi:FAD-dependent oxidoreductase [Paenibacillus lutimineralis]|uniref:Pyridine nucleotide-disulfide oxidoreductase n=1 Tax=Paenibacillus lutimineralis TaxID=2707005 RepID=A0A3S9V5P4_9BACL|nr:FAD-dependent oxidoreductase [Paenibacillus lutimineralis]AZS17891.1 pyridine nucleotide-disulfide oxidoreductase [Paenibacillus lutimineralis]
MTTFDAIIIGFGKGGKTLAVELSNHNWKVAVIERSNKMYGGTCINIACIPTKFLAHRAKQEQVKEVQDPKVRLALYDQAIQEKDELTAFLRQKNYNNLAQHENIQVFEGTASFVSDHEVQVTSDKETTVLSAPQIFINTGAETIIPNIPGARESQHVYTSTSIMDLKKLPKKLVIIGGGYIGLEFASIYRQFGSEVTILEGGSKFITREDRDVADAVYDVLSKKGIDLILNAKVIGLQDAQEGIILSYEVSGNAIELHVDAVLLATGRKPNVNGLNLEAAGVKLDERGAIQVDVHLRTSVSHIWALGDVKGGPQFTYISLDDYRIVKDDLFGNGTRRTEDRNNVPYSVFIDPPLSRVGLSEEEARQKKYNIKVAKLPAATIPRARLIQETDGFLKAIVDADTNKILGATLFCAESSEVINMVSMAIQMEQPYTFLRDHIFTHPTMSEALNDLFSQIKA